MVIKGVADKVDQYVNILKTNKISRPARRNSLLNQLSNQFILEQGESQAIVTLLIDKGCLHFDNAKAIWHI